MARGKKKESALTPEEKLAQALVPEEAQPYKVPPNWCWTRIAKLCTLSNGKAFKPTDWSETGVPIVRIQNLNNPDAEYNLFSGTVEEKFRLCGNELLFAWSGTPGTSFGAHIWWGKDAVLNQHIFRVDFNETYINKIFFKYAINQQLDMLISVAHGGAGLQHVTKGVFEATPIPLPPVAEQQRIVDRIEYLFAKLDEAKEKAQSVLDRFETRKAAILHKAFTGELTAKWRAEHGVNMTGWTHSHLGTYADSQYGYTESATTDPIGPHFLRITDIQDGQVNWASVPYCKIDSEKKNQYAIHRGDIVVARTGATTGKSYLVIDDVDAVYASYLIRVSLKSDLLNNRYLHAFMQSPEYWRQISDFSSGLAQPGVNGKKLKELELPIPSASEQYEIVRILDSLFAKEQQAKEAAEAVLEKIDLLKKSILARAFRGELGTNDPSEKSAVELLKEILEANSPVAPKKRSKSIPKELQEKLETELERKIIHLYFQREAESLPAEILLSVSSKKFDLLEALHNLEHRGLIKKLNNGNYRLLG